jgi:hypothetical protein
MQFALKQESSSTDALPNRDCRRPDIEDCPDIVRTDSGVKTCKLPRGRLCALPDWSDVPDRNNPPKR